MGVATREQPYGVCDRCGKRSERVYYGTEWGGYSLLREKRHVLVGDEIITQFYDRLICRGCWDDFTAFFSQPVAALPEVEAERVVVVPASKRVLVPAPAEAAAAPTDSTTGASPRPPRPARAATESTTESPKTPRTVARRPRPAVGTSAEAKSA